MPRAWHALAIEESATALGTDLVPDEAAGRLVAYSANELQEKPRPGFLALVLEQFKSFIVIILIAAVVVSIVLSEYIDAGVIQESKAEEALAALKRMAAPEARAVGGGQTLTVASRALVTGDCVLLEAGNFVSADVRLVESANLRVEETSLTGESLPVEKQAEEVLGEKASLGDRVTVLTGF